MLRLVYDATYDVAIPGFSLFVFLFFRERVIDKRIESAVSQMQSVIELGRVIRDRKTLPVKVNHQFYSKCKRYSEIKLKETYYISA